MGIRNVIAMLGRAPRGRLDRSIGTGYASTVTEDESAVGAEASLAYLACELAKARPVASLPVDVYESRGAGRVEAKDDASWHLAHLLKARWNPLMRSGPCLRWLILAKDTLGSAYVRVQWGTSKSGVRVPVALWPVTAAVEPLWDSDTGTAWYRTGGDDFTPPGTYSADDVVRFDSQLPSTATSVGGRSLAEAAFANIGLSIDLETFYKRLLTNGSHFPGYIETDNRLSDADLAELKDSLRGTAGVLQAGTVRVFANGLHYRQNPMTMGDIDLVAQQTWVLQQMCRITGVPPQEVYDLSRSTYSNAEQSSIQFSQKTLVPECRELECGFDEVLRVCGQYDRHVKFELNGLLRGEYMTRMEGYRIGTAAGILTRNECRSLEELSELPGLSRPLVPVNFYEVDENGDVVPYDDGRTDAPAVTDPAGGRPDDGFSPIVEDMRRRVRERFEERGDCESTRDFARRVFEPYARACTVAGIDFDMDREIEELSHE